MPEVASEFDAAKIENESDYEAIERISKLYGIRNLELMDLGKIVAALQTHNTSLVKQ